ETHADCEVVPVTNGTLIDEAFVQEMLLVKNFVPAIRLEGFEQANDGRRGAGVYQRVQDAMALLKRHGLPFGLSTCYTSSNWQDERPKGSPWRLSRSEEHTSELQSRFDLVCRLLLETKKL